MVFYFIDHEVIPLQKAPFRPISVSASNFNPRNIQCIPVVKIIALLEPEQKLTFFKGLSKLASVSIFVFFTTDNRRHTTAKLSGITNR